MRWSDWYTDTVDIWRVVQVNDGALTRQQRDSIAAGIPCRIYRSSQKELQTELTAAHADHTDMLACSNDVDILAGDELLIHRGARLGKEKETIRAFASDPNYYFEPFGAVIPGLSHQEIMLLNKERVK